MAQLRFIVDKKAILITDYRDMIKTINQVQPTLIKDLKKNIRSIAAPAQSAVKQRIPSVAPLSGMMRVHHGTKTWNYGAPAKSVLIDVRNSGKPNKKGYITLGRLRVRSVGTVLADMSGRSGKYVDKWTATKPYMYRYYKNGQAIDAPRAHRINGQGARMIDKLNERKGTASRFAWPAFEQAQPEIRAKAQLAIRRTFDLLHGQFMRGR